MIMESVVRRVTPRVVKDLLTRLSATRPMYPRSCPMCGYEGYFTHYGRPLRIDARCPACGSLERHRLFWLWFQGECNRLSEPILHFAPEKILERRFRKLYGQYQTADLYDAADRKLNIENIDLPAQSVRTVICNHVLEHVDDVKALAEIYRILLPDGTLIISVPLIEGWETSYERDDIQTPQLRELHFGQNDHLRFYGRDFRDRLRIAGFAIEEVTAGGQDVVAYGLQRGEKFFMCRKGTAS